MNNKKFAHVYQLPSRLKNISATKKHMAFNDINIENLKKFLREFTREKLKVVRNPNLVIN